MIYIKYRMQIIYIQHHFIQKVHNVEKYNQRHYIQIVHNKEKILFYINDLR